MGGDLYGIMGGSCGSVGRYGGGWGSRGGSSPRCPPPPLQATMLFAELPYTLATEEAERIGVDHVARMTATGSGENSTGGGGGWGGQRGGCGGDMGHYGGGHEGL